MKLISAGAVLASVFLLAACAAQPESIMTAQLEPVEPTEAAAQYDPEVLQEIKTNARTVAIAPQVESDVVCQRVTPTGSHISERRCYTRQALRRQSEEAQEWLRSGGLRGSVSEVYSVQ